MSKKSVQALAWVDFETTGLPDGNDFSGVHILEGSLIVTDMDLNKIAGSSVVVKMTNEAAKAIQGNEYVRKMHKENGLLADSIKSDSTLEDLESEFIEILHKETTFDKGEFGIAGSGVAAYDFPLIKEHMPNFAKWLAYYPYDSGIFRRFLKLTARDFQVPTVSASSGDDKTHRSLADVEAHIEEARAMQDWFRKIGEVHGG